MLIKNIGVEDILESIGVVLGRSINIAHPGRSVPQEVLPTIATAEHYG